MIYKHSTRFEFQTPVNNFFEIVFCCWESWLELLHVFYVMMIIFKNIFYSDLKYFLKKSF